jgi:hypothetical protein
MRLHEPNIKCHGPPSALVGTKEPGPAGVVVISIDELLEPGVCLRIRQGLVVAPSDSAH